MASILAAAFAAALSVWPVPGPVVARFTATGPYSAGHRGIDISAPAGTAVRAASGGVVAFTGRVAGNLTVAVESPGGMRVHYSYLGAVSVAAGDNVAPGDILGATGAGHGGGAQAGAARSPQLHFAVEVGGGYVDPLPLLPPRHVRLVA